MKRKNKNKIERIFFYKYSNILSLEPTKTRLRGFFYKYSNILSLEPTRIFFDKYSNILSLEPEYTLLGVPVPKTNLQLQSYDYRTNTEVHKNELDCNCKHSSCLDKTILLLMQNN
jgi:hypothetical protein